MTVALYRWPPAARFGRVVPKTKFYEHARVSAAVREKFVSEVQRITWAYKLAETTINLPGTPTVPEIQVFEVSAKSEDVSDSVLTAIDRAVKTPIIFEIGRGDGRERRVRMVARQKQVGTGAPKLGSYYSTGWQADDGNRQPLPAAISLAALYVALLEPLIPVTVRNGEELSEVTARLARISRIEREVAALQRKLRVEPQLNRKVELRRALRAKQAMLAHVTSPSPSATTRTTN